MKKFIYLFALAIISFSFVGDNSPFKIAVKKGAIVINKVNVTKDWNLSTFQNVLGSSSRSRDGYNKTHTYDDYGFVLFEPMKDKKPSGIISEYQIYFSAPEANEVTPKGTYSGTVLVDKLKVTASLTAATMLAKLKKWKKTDSYMEHSYRMANSGLYIYFQFNDSDSQLIKMSIGPDKQGKK